MKAEGWRVGGEGEGGEGGGGGGGRRGVIQQMSSGQCSSQGLQRRRPSFFLAFFHPSSHPGAMAVKTHLAVPALSSK